MEAAEAAAGPSRQTIEIPSTGLEYWEYRRACFLAGQPWPGPRTRAPDAPIPVPAIPEAYTVPPAPEPVASVPYTPSPSSSIGRLEALLGAFGAEESDIAWNGGVGGVARNLSGGKRLAKGLRLGLVIKVLRAGWLRDGTWPLDPLTARAVVAPASPEVAPSRAAPPPPVYALPSPGTAAPAAYTGMPLLDETANAASATAAPLMAPASASPPSSSLARIESPPRQLLPIPVRAGEGVALRRV
ncbi:uncharacterized protein EHS24_007061 [Apiotrichum porosum]|uniref:Uncharacterized protein n=1 Tax=Apiotrichum porosum TaxID=105984 RepID=A0A427XX56_9TREE|nr:uncharacterized protein EHS24_007061 [Apiotrichum porosum]RSH83381.1 hypothetical protein EHS24_007061 [Apiotrichum porosum]